MFYLIIHLYKEEFLEDVIVGLTGIGAQNTVVVNGTTARKMLAFDIPIFAGFRPELKRGAQFCKVIHAIIEDKSSVEEMIENLKDAGVDFADEEVGKIFLLPIEEIT